MAPRPFTYVLGGLALISAFFLFKPHASSARPAENFRLYSSRGRLISLDDYRGKIVLLDFYASWCKPCARAAPELDRINETYRRQGVVVIGVNVNDTADPVEYASRVGINYPILLHGEKVAASYGVTAIPSFIIIDPSGTIVHHASGWNSQIAEDLTDRLDALISGASR